MWDEEKEAVIEDKNVASSGVFHYHFSEHLWVIVDGRVVPAVAVRHDVGFGVGGIDASGSAAGEDPFEFSPLLRCATVLEFREDAFHVPVGREVRAGYVAHEFLHVAAVLDKGG